MEEIEKGFTTRRSTGAMARRFYVDTGIPVKIDEVYPWRIKGGKGYYNESDLFARNKY